MATSTNRPAEVFPAGEFLLEELDARDWTSQDLAELLGVDVEKVHEVILGKRRISADFAKRLGKALGTSPEVWLNLDDHGAAEPQSNN